MNTFKTNLIALTKIIVIGLLVGIFTSYALANWDEPPANPPSDNAPAPLNVSNVGQIKVGGLTLNTGGATNGLVVKEGTSIFGDPANWGPPEGNITKMFIDSTGLNLSGITYLFGIYADISSTANDEYGASFRLGGSGAGEHMAVEGSANGTNGNNIGGSFVAGGGNSTDNLGIYVGAGGTNATGIRISVPTTGTSTAIEATRGNVRLLGAPDLAYFGQSTEASSTTNHNVRVYGNVNADYYCSRSGTNCYTSQEMKDGGGGGGSDWKVKTWATDPTADYLAAKVQSSLAASGNFLQLLNDVAVPGNNKCYGTNATGVKGWYVCDIDTTAGGGILVTGSGHIPNSTVPTNLGSGFSWVNLSGSYGVDEGHPAGGFIYREGSVYKANLFFHANTYRYREFTITSESQGVHDGASASCTGVTGARICVRLNGTNIEIYASYSGTLKLQYITFGSGAGSGGLDEKVKASSSDSAAGFLDAKVANSVAVTANKLSLVGDLAIPGNNKYYGTNATGVRGWYDLAQNGNRNVVWSQRYTGSSPITSIVIPAGVDELVIVPTARMFCDLPPDSGKSIEMDFRAGIGAATPTHYASLQTGAGNNNGGETRIEASTAGSIFVSAGATVNLTAYKSIYGSTGTLQGTGLWTSAGPSDGDCTSSSPFFESEFMGYTFYGLGAGSGGGGGGTDDKTVRTSSSDTLSGFLFSELVAGTNVTISETGVGDKKVTIHAATGGALSPGFHAPPLGTAKLVAGFTPRWDVTRANKLQFSRPLKEGTSLTSTWFSGSRSAYSRISGGLVQTRLSLNNGLCDTGYLNGNFARCGTEQYCAMTTYEGLIVIELGSGVSCPPAATAPTQEEEAPLKPWEEFN